MPPITPSPTPDSGLPPAVPVMDLPVVVIGAGPVGLAAAAHLHAYGLTPLVLEAGSEVGAAVAEWGHVRTFTPWRLVIDAAAEKVLTGIGWARPNDDVSPTGTKIVRDYLVPLAAALRAELGHEAVRTGARVVSVTRDGLDPRGTSHDDQPFVVRVAGPAGQWEARARAVIDASGTWRQPNPLGASGLPAPGEEEARAAGLVLGPLPDVLGRDRSRFAGKRTVVVGMGHSAAGTLLALAHLAAQAPGTEVVWAIRATDAARLYGGGDADQLRDRGRLGTDLQQLVATGAVDQVTRFFTTSMEVAPDGASATVIGDTPTGQRRIEGVHAVVAATGFRPDLGMLAGVRLDLDPGLQAPTALAPLIDPAVHSCGTVPPHGHTELTHPDHGFYLAGMKSYGRAPTFLITTGNEQVRSIAAHLAGDSAAADQVRLVLPETGVCSTNPAVVGDLASAAQLPAPGGACCG